MVSDPNEWTNLATRPEHAKDLEEHRKWLPTVNLKPVPGSRDRILLYDSTTGVANWEGQNIETDAPIPEIED